jgi:hypothetical protein
MVALLIAAISGVSIRDAVGQTRLGLHVTQEELNIWKQRASSGPYKTTGDVSSNSPGDWTRIQSNANSFLSSPSAQRWAGQTTVSCRLESAVGSPSRTHGERLRDAGFMYLVTGNTSYRDAVRTELLAQAATPGTDFSDATRWCINDQMSPSGTMLEINMWLNKILFGYDYIRSSLDADDQAKLDTWFLNAGEYLEAMLHHWVSKRFPNRLSDDYSSSPWPQGGSRGKLYFGGPDYYEWHAVWDNLCTLQARTFGFIGILTNDATLKDRAKRYVKEYVRFGLWFTKTGNLVTPGEVYRWGAFGTAVVTHGWEYPMAALPAILNIADAFARTGDMELYTYTSSAGFNGSEGGPKSLQAAATTMLKMMDHQIIRYGSSTSTTDPNKIIDNIDAAGWHSILDTSLAMPNLYFRDSYWRSAYTRIASGTTGYPSSISGVGCSEWQGAWCIYPGVLFMFGQMEGKVSPYPGTTVSTPPPPSSSINPIGYWKFDEASGTIAKDSSGTGNHGTLVNGTGWTAGKSGSAVSFDGLDDFVKVATTGFSTSQGTFTAWVKAPAFKSSPQYIFGHTTLPPYGSRIQLYSDDTGGFLDLGFGDSNPRALNIQQLQPNIWHHVGITWSSGSYAAYVNGIQKTTGSYSGLTSLNSYAHIGGIGNDSNPLPWNGTIDEVKVWNRALSSADIKNEYNSYQEFLPTAPSDLTAIVH